MSDALIHAPARVRANTAFDVKALISHPMETGFRVGENGALIARNIIARMTARFDGEEIFDLTLSPAISANPYIAFQMRIAQSGTLELRWQGDNGFAAMHRVAIEVE